MVYQTLGNFSDLSTRQGSVSDTAGPKDRAVFTNLSPIGWSDLLLLSVHRFRKELHFPGCRFRSPLFVFNILWSRIHPRYYGQSSPWRRLTIACSDRDHSLRVEPWSLTTGTYTYTEWPRNCFPHFLRHHWQHPCNLYFEFNEIVSVSSRRSWSLSINYCQSNLIRIVYSIFCPHCGLKMRDISSFHLSRTPWSKTK